MDKICDPDTEILIFILTTPENRFFRRQQRRVWANKCNLGIHKIRSVMLMGLHPHLYELTKDLNKTDSGRARRSPEPGTSVDYSQRLRVTHQGFIVNTSIVAENMKHGDVVMIDYPESYQNLTYKVAAGFMWARKYCPQALLVGKVDDDVFLGVDRLMRYLQGYTGGKKVIGAHNMVYTPARWNASRWYVTFEDFPRKIYPPYANGFTYFLTQDYVKEMLVYLAGRKLLPVEDVQLTGIVADAIGAERIYSFLDFAGKCTFNGDCSYLGRWLNETDSTYESGPISVLCFDTNYEEFARQRLALQRLQRFSKKIGLTGWPYE